MNLEGKFEMEGGVREVIMSFRVEEEVIGAVRMHIGELV